MTKYRVVGDTTNTIYSRHVSEDAACRAAKHLARKWGRSNVVGTEPRVDELTEDGWQTIWSYATYSGQDLRI